MRFFRAGRSASSVVSLTQIERFAAELAALDIEFAAITQASLTLPARGPEGFEISVLLNGKGFTVAIGEIETHFDTRLEALEFIQQVRAEDCRLRTDWHGGKPRRWVIERKLVCGRWFEMASFGHAGWFSRSCEIVSEYRSNLAARPVHTLSALLLIASTALPFATYPASGLAKAPDVPAPTFERGSPSLVYELVEAGIVLGRGGQIKEAIGKFNEALGLEPNYALAYLNRGVSHMHLGDMRQAIEDFTQSIRLDPAGVEAYQNRGMVYWTARDYRAAAGDFEQAINIAPAYPFAYVGRALIHAAYGAHQSAIADCDRAQALGAREAKLFATRAFAYLALGQRDKAIQDFVAAADADPQNAQRYQAIAASMAR
jgi:tetratricopeptide (TPR) repeat protein